jgi:hypothetical protein
LATLNSSVPLAAHTYDPISNMYIHTVRFFSTTRPLLVCAGARRREGTVSQSVSQLVRCMYIKTSGVPDFGLCWYSWKIFFSSYVPNLPRPRHFFFPFPASRLFFFAFFLFFIYFLAFSFALSNPLFSPCIAPNTYISCILIFEFFWNPFCFLFFPRIGVYADPTRSERQYTCPNKLSGLRCIYSQLASSVS